MELIAILAIVATCFQFAFARATHREKPYLALQTRHTTSWNITASPKVLNSGPTVDLGYGIYQGVYNASWNLNTFKG